MKHYTNPHIGIQFPLQELKVYKEEDGWLVLKNPDAEAYLSLQFCFQFFTSPEEIEQYIQNEIQAVANANDLVEFAGINRQGDDFITASWFQYINNISNLVYVGARLLAGKPGLWYMAVTKDEVMTGHCERIFFNTKITEKNSVGQPDKSTESKLSNHTLKYLSSYNSNWGSGGGTSTEKFYTLYPDHTFGYQFSSVVSFGSMGGGNTSQDEGRGIWEVQKNAEGSFLILYWHLKGLSAFQLQWGEPGILFLDGEKYLVD